MGGMDSVGSSVQICCAKLKQSDVKMEQLADYLPEMQIQYFFKPTLCGLPFMGCSRMDLKSVKSCH